MNLLLSASVAALLLAGPLGAGETPNEVEKARQFRRRGELSAAERAYRQAMEKRPADPGLFAELGRLYEEMGRLPDAAAQYRRAVDAAPDNFSFRLQLAKLLMRLGRPDEAAAQYRAARDLPESAAEFVERGYDALAPDKRDEAGAVELFEEAAARNPESSDVHHHAAMGLIEKGDYAEAERRLRRSLRLWSGRPNIHRETRAHTLAALTQLLVHQQREEEAKRLLKEIADRLGQDPADDPVSRGFALYLLTELLASEGRRKETEKLLMDVAVARAGPLSIHDVQVLMSLQPAYIRSTVLPRARKILGRALRRKNLSRQERTILALKAAAIELQLADRKKARERLDPLDDLLSTPFPDPRDQAGFYNYLGAILMQIPDEPAAERVYQTAISEIEILPPYLTALAAEGLAAVQEGAGRPGEAAASKRLADGLFRKAEAFCLFHKR
jgi:tetratricopeptide (TPR) repeat protein